MTSTASPAGVQGHRHPAVAGAGVPDGVGDRLDHDAVGGDLDGGRQRGQVVTGVHAGRQAGPGGQPLDGLGARACQAELVQGGRAQPFDQAPDIDHGAADLLAEVVQLAGGAVAARREQRPRGLGLQRQPGQRRADAVVQVPAQPAPFFLPGQDEALPRALQVLAEQPRVQRAAELPGQVVHQPFLGRAQRAIRHPVGQGTDRDAVGQQWNAGRTRVGTAIVPGTAAAAEPRARPAAAASAGAGDDGPVEIADADVAQIQPGGELGDGGGQQPVDVGGGFQAARRGRPAPHTAHAIGRRPRG